MFTTQRITLYLLILISAIYLLLGYLYATQTPAWQVPDEPAHYNYIRQLIEDEHFPVLKIGDWDSDYQGLLTSTGFNPQYTADLDRVQYEDHQPPLYYLMASVVYWFSDGNLTAIRLFSVLLGLGVVVSAFGAIYQLFPHHPWLALGTAAFVAFIPQHLAMLGGVNNDALAELLIGVTLLSVVNYLKRAENPPKLRETATLGVLVGLAFLTKSTIYFLAGVVGLAILLKWRRSRWSFEVGAKQIAVYLLPALLIGAVWWGRNLEVYGGTDFLGLGRHNVVAADQLQTHDYIERDLGGDKGLYRKNYLYTTFHSFWGQFGWMGVPMPTKIYRALLIDMLIALLGSVVYALREKWFGSLQAHQGEMLLLLVTTMILVLTAYLSYNLKFVQFQGRYLFPALIPVGLWMSLGLAGWVNLFDIKAQRWLIVALMLLLAVFAFYALHIYIVPNLPNWN